MTNYLRTEQYAEPRLHVASLRHGRHQPIVFFDNRRREALTTESMAAATEAAEPSLVAAFNWIMTTDQPLLDQGEAPTAGVRAAVVQELVEYSLARGIAPKTIMASFDIAATPLIAEAMPE